MQLLERYQGCLLGLAAGDAVGTTIEFSPPDTFALLTDMVGGGPFHLTPGQWTDDTSMAICLADSLIERRGFDPLDQMERYDRWYRHGYLSSTGRCFDIGRATRLALQRFEKTREPYCGVTDPAVAGNGSLMRLAPVPLAYRRQPEQALALAAASSRTTHAAPTPLDACRYYSGLIVAALNGESKETLLAPSHSPVADAWECQPLDPEIAAVAQGSFKDRQPPEIKGSGYVVRSLEAALWAFYHSTSFADGCLQAANLGDDADTTAAIYGQLAGAYYGIQAIPAAWHAKLARLTELENFAARLLELSEQL